MVQAGKQFAAVTAVTKDGGIGWMGRLPWHPTRLHFDMAFLHWITTSHHSIDEHEFKVSNDNNIQNTVIMGFKTWESLPKRVKPLPGRLNIVLSGTVKRLADYPQVLIASSLDNSLSQCINQVFILGGQNVYTTAIEHDGCTGVFMTVLLEQPESIKADVFFPIDSLKSRFRMSINLTEAIYNQLILNSPEAKDKGSLQCIDGQCAIREGDYAYSIVYYYRRI